MDIDTEARISAIELLFANLLAQQLRAAPEPAESAARALRVVLAQVDDMKLCRDTEDENSTLRVRIGDAAHDILQRAARLGVE